MSNLCDKGEHNLVLLSCRVAKEYARGGKQDDPEAIEYKYLEHAW